MQLVTLKRRTLDGGADLTWVAHLVGQSRAHVHGAQLDAGDTLPRHPTPVWQVFAVLSGDRGGGRLGRRPPTDRSGHGGHLVTR